MCLAIYRGPTASGRITADDLLRSWESGNNDGYGAMFAERGKVYTWKSTDKNGFPMFCKWVEELQDAQVPLGVHLRLATHGKKDEKNAHPFEVIPGKLALIHNGILRGYDRNGNDSDTAIFSAQVATLGDPAWWWDNDFIWALLAEYAGWSNKLVFLRDTGEAKIIGAKQGVSENGIWYSNDSFKPAKPKPVTAVVPYKHRGPIQHSGDNWPAWYRDQQTRLNSDTPDPADAKPLSRKEKKLLKKQERDAKHAERRKNWQPSKESIWKMSFMGTTLHICGACVKDACEQTERTATYVLPNNRHDLPVDHCEWCAEKFAHHIS